MTDEQFEAFGEQVANLTERLGEMTAALDKSIQTQSQLFQAASGTKIKLDGLSSSADGAGTALKNKAKIEQEIAQEEQKRDASRESAQNAAVRSLASFGDALLSTEKGFSKFSESFGYAGDAAFDLGKSFGGLPGIILGGIVKGFSVVAQMALGQADAMLTARDDLYKLGGAGSFTSRELLEMGKSAGLNSRNLELLVKPIKSMGPAILSLGTSAGDSMQAFARLASVTEEERMRMNRLGVSQEDLMQEQADFVKLQSMSGVQISSRYKTEEQLRKASLDYVTNLRELSIITGEDVDTIKQRQQAAANEAELMIRQFQLEEQAIQLRKDGNIEEALKIEAQVKAEKAFMEQVSALGDPALTAGFTEFLATGGNITSEAGAKLLRLGVDLDEVGSRLKAGDINAGQFAIENYAESLRDTMRGGVGDAARYSEEAREAYALTSTSIGFAIKNAGTDIEEAGKEAAANVANAQAEGTDDLATARANLVEVEIIAKQSLDDLILSTVNVADIFDMLTSAIENLIEYIPGVTTKREIQSDIDEQRQKLIDSRATAAAIPRDAEGNVSGGIFGGDRYKLTEANNDIIEAERSLANLTAQMVEKGGKVDSTIVQDAIQSLTTQLSQIPVVTEQTDAQNAMSSLDAAYVAGTGVTPKENDDLRAELLAKIELLQGAKTTNIQTETTALGTQTPEVPPATKVTMGVAQSNSAANTDIQTPSLATSTASTVSRTQTPDQTVTSMTPQTEALSREGYRTLPRPEEITASVPETDINDIMSMLSNKLDNVISLLETGVTIQDGLLLAARN